jgi:hypothetical protein
MTEFPVLVSPMRPRLISFVFPLAEALGRDAALTRPNASLVTICCSSCSLRSKASCSSAFRSASSSFFASSSSESVPSSDEPDDVGLSGRCTFLGPWTVSVDDEDAFLGRGELLPSELRRARTPRGVERRPDGDILPLPVSRLTAREATVCFSAECSSSKGLAGGWPVEGLETPGMSCNPRSSSWNLAWTRYSRYGSGTSRCAASPFPTRCD